MNNPVRIAQIAVLEITALSFKLPANFLSVPYMFYPLSCMVAVKSVKFKE